MHARHAVVPSKVDRFRHPRTDRFQGELQYLDAEVANVLSLRVQSTDGRVKL